MTGDISFTQSALEFMRQDFWGPIHKQIYADRDVLGEALVALVRRNTPERTGALLEGVAYELGNSDEELVRVYEEAGPQLSAWDRIYVQYQEGEPLGMHTYTNAPHQQFLQASQQADQLGLVARNSVQRAISWICGR